MWDLVPNFNAKVNSLFSAEGKLRSNTELQHGLETGHFQFEDLEAF